jgi:parallel beta-helix repeat protein
MQRMQSGRPARHARATAIAIAVVAFSSFSGSRAIAQHIHCGDVITADTKLDSDLLDCPGDGIVTAGEDVTVDLGGHTIDGDGSPGHYAVREAATAGNGLTVEEGTVSDFGVGLFDGSDALIRDITFRDTGLLVADYDKVVVERNFFDNSALSLEHAGAQVIGNVFSGDGSGIAVFAHSGQPTRIERNRISGYHEGIGCNQCARLDVERNVFSGNGLAIAGDEAAFLRIAHNRIFENRYGIYLTFAPANVIEDNTVTGNEEEGIALVAPATHNRIVGNVVSRNGEAGISLRTGEYRPCLFDNEVAANRVFRNHGNGISIEGRSRLSDPDGCPANDAQPVRVVSNDVHDNQLDGINVASDIKLLLERNVTDRNGDDGIDVDGAPGRDTEPAWSPDGAAIALVSRRGADTGLYAVRLAGEALTKLAPLPDQQSNVDPAWSPDGSKIAFEDQGLNTVNPDGTELRKLFEGGAREPAWSPDSAHIAFASVGVQVIDTDGGGLWSVTPGAEPAWSPDGQKIAFIRGGPASEVWVVNADGSGARSIIAGDHASWSPDGSRLVVSDAGALEVVNVDGSGVRGLPVEGFEPEWSPDGSVILFRELNRSDLFLIEPNGRGLRSLTDRRGVEQWATWSPDGSRIAYGDGLGVYIINRNGSGLTRVQVALNRFAMLTANRADRNADLGIEGAAGVQDGGGNRASHNGDPAQCTNIECR